MRSCFSHSTYRGDRVPTRRLSVRKIKELLRLRFELGLGQRAIALGCSISQTRVSSGLSKRSGTRKASTGHCLEIGEPRSSSYARASRFSIVRPALPQHPHVTLRLAWEEDREKNPQGYRTAGSASWAMAPEAGCGSAPRAQARREGLRRLGRSEDLGARFSDRGGMASLSVREVLGA
jgi:hypothetical protein